jgi:predicted nucleic acid-binding Zn ribbon protein
VGANLSLPAASRCVSCAAAIPTAAAVCSTCGTETVADAIRTVDKSTKKAQYEITYEPGTLIVFKDVKQPEELNGTSGTVVEAQGDGKYTVSSDTGALLKGLSAKNLILKILVPPPVANESYAPMTSNYESSTTGKAPSPPPREHSFASSRQPTMVRTVLERSSQHRVFGWAQCGNEGASPRAWLPWCGFQVGT